MQEELLAKAREAVRAKSRADFADNSRRRLSHVISRKMKTAFIHAISEFERTFGPVLWASCDTPEQQAAYEKWMQVRKSIFNTGHSQIRAVEAELALHLITFQGYHAQAVVGGQQDGEEKDRH